MQQVQVNCCARLVQRTPDSQKGACCAAPMSPGISGDAHSPKGNTTVEQQDQVKKKGFESSCTKETAGMPSGSVDQEIN